MATLEQIQSVIDLNESENRNLNGWDQSIGQYKNPSNYPTELKHAKRKKIEQTPVVTSIMYKLVRNSVAETITVLKNGVELVVLPYTFQTVSVGEFSIESDSQIISFLSNSPEDVSYFDSVQIDVSEFLILDGSAWTDFGISNSNWSVEMAYLMYGITGTFTSFNTTRGFTYDQDTYIITGPTA